MDLIPSEKNGGVLNEGVGADYVQKEKVVPPGFDSKDAGIREQLSILSKQEDMRKSYEARLGIVQTAYANGASTNYLKQLGLEVNFTPTGVKHLHEKASEYDVGIFEANGHGTVFSFRIFIGWLETRTNELSSGPKGSQVEKAALRLLAVSKLINQAVGDALSGLLLVEVILQHLGWTIHKWNELYQDLPIRQLKVKVADRTAVMSTNAETVAVSPPFLQKAINAETARYPQFLGLRRFDNKQGL